MNELCRLTARQVVDLLEKKKVSPLELIDAALGRVQETDGDVNAPTDPMPREGPCPRDEPDSRGAGRPAAGVPSWLAPSR